MLVTAPIASTGVALEDGSAEDAPVGDQQIHAVSTPICTPSHVVGPAQVDRPD
jgi:hypothetical protein